MSGGTEGGMAPHWTVFERAESEERKGPALAIGRAHTPALPAEHLGRMPQVEMVAAAVHAAMADAGITDPADVHFVQVKCPLLTVQRIGEAEARGASLATKRHAPKSMGLSRAASALGVAAALGEPERCFARGADRRATGMCGRAAPAARQGSNCWATRSSCSACRLRGAGRSPSITPSWRMRSTSSRCAARSAVSAFRPPANCRQRNAGAWSRCWPRPRRATTAACAAIGTPCWTTPIFRPPATPAPSSAARLAGLVGHAEIYVSGGAEHQGPDGGGPVALIVDRTVP